MCILSLRLGFALHLDDEALAFLGGDGDILHVRSSLWWLDGCGVFTMPQRTAACSIILCIYLDSLRCEMGEQTATGICFPIRFGLWSVWSSPIRHRLGYGAQVGRKDSPAHPSIESFLTPIPATAQILAALHDADAPFYSSPKPPCPLEPSLPLVLLALLTFLPSFGQAYLLPPISFASRSFSLECTLRSAATSSGGLPNKRR